MSKELIPAGVVVLRGEAAEIDSDIGRAFVTDLCRHEEEIEIASAEALQLKWQCDEQAIATNEPLIQAVALELERRVYSGAAARDRAAVEFSRAPARLGHMLHDKLEASRVKIDAAKELRAIASSGGAAEGAGRDHFTITIITGSAPDQAPFIVNVPKPLPAPPEEREELLPITIAAPLRSTEDDDPRAGY